jgi:hypothetical protein
MYPLRGNKQWLSDLPVPLVCGYVTVCPTLGVVGAACALNR